MAVVKANYVQRGRDERKGAKAHIYYIQTRPGREKVRLTRTLFDAAAMLGRQEAYQFITAAPKGTFFYRLKLSPDPRREDTRRDLNMQKLTRTMMQRLEKRLKTAVPWAAALHDDHTTIRHVHILAAVPRRLQKYELEYLIREATQACVEQRRRLDLSVDRQRFAAQRAFGPERTAQKPSTHTMQTWKHIPLSGDRYDYRNHLSSPIHRGGRPVQGNSTCTCPRCHFAQTHNRHTGVHQCVSCGIMLHTKRELTLQRKGREWERSL